MDIRFNVGDRVHWRLPFGRLVQVRLRGSHAYPAGVVWWVDWDGTEMTAMEAELSPISPREECPACGRAL